MLFDEKRGRLVLHGGRDQNGEFNDLWEWDGEDWRPLPLAVTPPPTSGHGLVYDDSIEQVVAVVDGKVWNFGTTLPAEFNTYGSGCGPQGAIRLVQEPWGGPWIDETPSAALPYELEFSLRATNVPPASPGVFVIGINEASLPIPLGGAGCRLLTQPIPGLALPVGADGAISLTAPVPDTALIDVPMYGQALIVSGSGVLGSEGVQLVSGRR